MTQGKDEDETLAAQFNPRLIDKLLPGLQAKSIPARFRATQLLAGILRVLPGVSKKIYPDLRESLLDRINDKEAAIRVQAVMAVARLCSREEDEDSDEDEPALKEDDIPMKEILADVLAHDNSAYVSLYIIDLSFVLTG